MTTLLNRRLQIREAETLLKAGLNLKHDWSRGVYPFLRRSSAEHHQTLGILDGAFVIYDEL